MIEVAASSDVDAQSVKDKIADLKSKYGERLEEQNIGFDLTETVDLTSYYRGSFRVGLFDKATEKSDLISQIEGELELSASWWRVRYHECDHDEIEKSGCSWEYSNSSGTVLEAI
jgi:hypothetical protein